MTLDKYIQGLTIGFGLGSDGTAWNRVHQKHHAAPQKIGFDQDMEVTPLVSDESNLL